MALTRAMAFGVDVGKPDGDRSVLAVLDLDSGELSTDNWPTSVEDQVDVLVTHLRRRAGPAPIILHADAGGEWMHLRGRLLLHGIDVRVADLGWSRRRERLERALVRVGLTLHETGGA